MNETENLIKEQFNSLPSNLQRAINAVPWKKIIQEIGKTNLLDAEQTASLEQETMFIIYAFENPKDYIPNIIKGIGVTEDIATKIADAVGEQILTPILKESDNEQNNPEQQFKSDNLPEIALDNLPMVEEGEVAHEVPHIESPMNNTEEAEIKTEEKKPDLPDYRYPDGKDPYRELPQ